MTKLNITRLGSVTSNDAAATAAINNNFRAIQDAVENTLSRDGTTPNFMDSDLDLNNHKIINVKDPEASTDVITKGWFDQFVDDASSAAGEALASALAAASSAQASNISATEARDWATKMDDPVEGTDYSSKYYASLINNIATDIEIVAAIDNDVTAVANNSEDISTVASDIAKLTAVADDLTNIDAVNANKTNIDTVAGDLTNINAVAADLTNIDNASAYAAEAKQWAISQNVVDNEDYSSKYWARKSKEWAESVSSPVNKNLSNLNPQGQNIANWSTNVTNCITEIAQNIKLELNNGTLTLKAGSKVYVPNGSGVFDTVNIQSDISRSTFGTGTGTFEIFLNYLKNGLSFQIITRCTSGGSQPSDYGMWYDTTNNVVKLLTTGGSLDSSGYSFPLCIATLSSGTVTSIDQVFNGFGYIGSTVFALPGVKGLMPNGRNEDGTLKNLEFTTRGVLTLTGSGNFKGVGIYINATYLQYYGRPYFVANELSDIPSNFGGVGYIISENMLYTFNNGKIQNKQTYCVAGVYDWTNSAITSLTPKTPFHALDRNDSSTISGWSMPSSSYIDLNLGASGATYTAPANGYFCLDKAGTQNEYIDIRNNTTGLLRSKTTISASGTESIAVYMPCKKGDEIAVVYTATGTTNKFRFIYAEGENV